MEQTGAPPDAVYKAQITSGRPIFDPGMVTGFFFCADANKMLKILFAEPVSKRVLSFLHWGPHALFFPRIVVAHSLFFRAGALTAFLFWRLRSVPKARRCIAGSCGRALPADLYSPVEAQDFVIKSEPCAERRRHFSVFLLNCCLALS